MADMPKLVVATVVVAIIGAVALAPLAGAVNDNTGTQSVTNETVAADTGNYVDLTGYNVDNSETVYGFNDTSGSYEVASEGTDYEFRYQEGQIKALNGSSLIDDGEDVKVTYDYQAAGSTTSLIVGYVPLGVGLLLFVVVAQRVQQVMN